MSFILDALKKSELERQRQNAPGLMQSATLRPRPRLPVWAVVLVVLLGINLLGLMYMLTRGGAAPPTAMPANTGSAGHGDTAPVRGAESHETDTAATGSTDIRGAQTRSVDEPAAGNDAPFSPLDASPVYAPEIPVTGSPASGIQVASSPVAGNARALHRRDPLLNDQDFKAEDAEILPTINELNLRGAQALPELHLDVHVFSTRPADRFVYVNMRKYHEGATLQEGPTVERIRRDGAVLNYQGLRFLLPRQ